MAACSNCSTRPASARRACESHLCARTPQGVLRLRSHAPGRASTSLARPRACFDRRRRGGESLREDVVSTNASECVETDLPLRLDRLPWLRFHWLVVIALGVTWVLDGLEVTVVSAVASVLQSKATLGLSGAQI